MKVYAAIAAISVILMSWVLIPSASAQQVPEWVKNNAGWWAEGMISENEFVSAIQYLIMENVIQVPPTRSSAEESQNVPEWVKNNAGWWAAGIITDEEFVRGIQHLISIGVISIPSSEPTTAQPPVYEEKAQSNDSQLVSLEEDLQKCSEIKKAYDRLNCEKEAKLAITVYKYQQSAQVFKVGPMDFYWMGIPSEGNSLEISDSGQAVLSLRLLALNARGTSTVSMMCTGPSICNYDVFNGDKAYKYSGNDFTNGNIVLNPGQAREFNMLFGPNIGYGGTTFEYDSSKNYVFRINEPFGSVSIPIPLE